MRNIMKTLIVTLCMAGLSALAFAQNATAPPPRITAADAKSHHDETVTVCGKVVDTKSSQVRTCRPRQTRKFRYRSA